MKLPPPNSNQHKITTVLLTGVAITPQEGVGLHGTMRLTLAEISDLYRDLVVRGCAVQMGPRIAASQALLDKYGLVYASCEPPRVRVPARTAPPFRPLSVNLMPSSRGLRPGSNDMRAMPSHYPPQPKREGEPA